MKLIITTIFILTGLIAFGQNKQVEELSKIYMSGDFDLTIKRANEFLQNNPNNIDYKLLLGRALADKGDYQSAIPHLEHTVANDPNNSWRKAWALAYLGHCRFMTEDYDESKESLSECIALNVTKNATRQAMGLKLLCGMDGFYADWQIVESENFRFHFQSMSQMDTEKYVQSRESAFKKINHFFESNLPKKIDFFVWDSREDAKKLMNANLGFANPSFCVVHSHVEQTIGHEITHVISNYTSDIAVKTRFINEGTAVCFDQTQRDLLKMIKDGVAANNNEIRLMDYWDNGGRYAEEDLYPLSGLFVKELIDVFGKEKFLEFFKNQTYNHAKSVFGDQLDNIIKDFENKINT